MSSEQVTCPRCAGRGVIDRNRGGRPRELPDETRRLVVELSRTMNPYALARKLNDDGVPTARGGRWYDTTVRAILRSEGTRSRSHSRRR